MKYRIKIDARIRRARDVESVGDALRSLMAETVDVPAEAVDGHAAARRRRGGGASFHVDFDEADRDRDSALAASRAIGEAIGASGWWIDVLDEFTVSVWGAATESDFRMVGFTANDFAGWRRDFALDEAGLS